MATFQQLQDDVASWLNRGNVSKDIPGWVKMTETEIAETLRARCMVVTGKQPIDNAYITLPVDFATMESIRDDTSGEPLELKDEWSGHWTGSNQNVWQQGAFISYAAPATAYRLVDTCIEFLPHPFIPDPPDPSWRPQVVRMSWYAKPTPLILPSDTNSVLEELYAVYLYGVLRHGAIFELDDDRAAQMDASWQQVITRANMWKQQADYSGAPYRAEMAVVF